MAKGIFFFCTFIHTFLRLRCEHRVVCIADKTFAMSCKTKTFSTNKAQVHVVAVVVVVVVLTWLAMADLREKIHTTYSYTNKWVSFK